LNPNQIPLEDFFTEIFTYLLKSNPSLMDDWIKEFKISSIKPNNVYISTQESFDALNYHFSGSRPDIFIELSDDNKKDLIFVECKIGSCEGHNQLKRYAEHLDNIEYINRGILIYITKDYDKKNGLAIFESCNNKNKLKFIQFRWYEIYQFLKSHDGFSENVLVKDILRFMEEYDLSGDNRFTSVDILALTNFPRVRKMMDETMYGEVSDKFTEIAGGISSPSFCLTQIKNHNRYTYIQNQNDNVFEIVLGYWINDSKMTDFPKVGIKLGVSPNATHRKEIIAAMRDIVKSNPDEWNGYHLNESKNWAGIGKELGIEHFMNEQDHIKSIQDYFLNLIDELTDIKKQYPNLPWKV
jgi:hypothetical protein